MLVITNKCLSDLCKEIFGKAAGYMRFLNKLTYCKFVCSCFLILGANISKSLLTESHNQAFYATLEVKEIKKIVLESCRNLSL